MYWHSNPERGTGWVRLFGWGFYWKDTRCSPLLFSERMGLRRVLRIGPWAVGGVRREQRDG